MSDLNLPEIDIDVKNVVLEEIRNPPYKAKVDLEKVYIARADRSEVKREVSTVSVVFSFKQKIENDLVTINPLGLTITYFREDKAFQPPLTNKPLITPTAAEPTSAKSQASFKRSGRFRISPSGRWKLFSGSWWPSSAQTGQRSMPPES